MKIKPLFFLLCLIYLHSSTAQNPQNEPSHKMPAADREVYARIDSLIMAKANEYKHKPMKELFQDLFKYKINFKSYNLYYDLMDYQNFLGFRLNPYTLDEMDNKRDDGYETYMLFINLTQKYPRQCDNIYLDRQADFSNDEISWSSFKTALSQKVIENISLEIIPPALYLKDL